MRNTRRADENYDQSRLRAIEAEKRALEPESEPELFRLRTEFGREIFQLSGAPAMVPEGLRRPIASDVQHQKADVREKLPNRLFCGDFHTKLFCEKCGALRRLLHASVNYAILNVWDCPQEPPETGHQR
jgi:hypothetical protein